MRKCKTEFHSSTRSRFNLGMPDGRPALLGGGQVEAVFTTIFLGYFFGYVGLARNGLLVHDGMINWCFTEDF